MQTARIANAEHQNSEEAAVSVSGLDEHRSEWGSGVPGSDEIAADDKQCVEDRSRTISVPLSVSAQTIVAQHERMMCDRLERIQAIIQEIYAKDGLSKAEQKRFLKLWYRWGLIARTRPRFEW